MRRILPILFAAVLLLMPASLCDDSDAVRTLPEMPDLSRYDLMKISMVHPRNPEGFTISNDGYFTRDLRDYQITDGEGSVTFTERMELGSGQSMTFLASEPEPWMGITDYVLFGDRGVTAKKFALADNGDDIYLKKGDETLDSFSWGTSFEDGATPNGLSKIPKKTFAYQTYRSLGGDAGRGYVWRAAAPGCTDFRNCSTVRGCSVSPFSFPESDGSEIIGALQDADDRVDISIYTISHPGIASVLSHLLGKGVRVSILVEGSPAGGITAEEIMMLTSLSRAGADVRVIKSEDSYKRYAYVHTKYAVIDGDTCIVTSENWTESSFSGNRGWGCVIRSEGCASFMERIFLLDFDGGREDIHGLREVYPTSTSMRIPEFVPVHNDLKWYTADVDPVLSPDYSRRDLLEYLSAADERVYSQQLYVEYDWLGKNGNPLSEMECLAHNGVDCRLLVDVTYDDPFDSDLKDGYGICAYYEENGLLDVRYEDSPEFGMAHNKGVVKDDSVWIGSMNWTDNSIDSNREMSVIVYSKEVSDYFAGLFLKDWGTEYEGTVELRVDVQGEGYGTQTRLDASNSVLPQGCTYQWDLDGDGDIDREGRSVNWRFYRESECLLTVTDPDGNVYEHAFTVQFEDEEEEAEKKGFLDGPLKYLPLAALCAIIIAVKRLRQ